MEQNVNTRPVNKQRDVYTDALKCLLILMVIRAHVASFGFGIQESFEHLSSYMQFSFRMPLFFFMSGYYSYKKSMTGSDIRRSIYTKFLYLILPPLFFSIYDNLLNGAYILNFINEGFGKYWFTITLFICFILYYLLRIFLKSKIALSIGLLLFSGIGIGCLVFCDLEQMKYMELNRLAKDFQYFSFGIIAKMYYDKFVLFVTNQKVITLATVGFFGLTAVMFRYHLPNAVHHFLQYLLLRYLASFVVFSVFFCNKERFQQNTWINRLVIFVGRYTFPIYLLHYFFLPDLSHLRDTITNDIMLLNIIGYAYSIVILLVCLAFTWILTNSSLISNYVLGHRK